MKLRHLGMGLALSLSVTAFAQQQKKVQTKSLAQPNAPIQQQAQQQAAVESDLGGATSVTDSLGQSSALRFQFLHESYASAARLNRSEKGAFTDAYNYLAVGGQVNEALTLQYRQQFLFQYNQTADAETGAHIDDGFFNFIFNKPIAFAGGEISNSVRLFIPMSDASKQDGVIQSRLYSTYSYDAGKWNLSFTFNPRVFAYTKGTRGKKIFRALYFSGFSYSVSDAFKPYLTLIYDHSYSREGAGATNEDYFENELGLNYAFNKTLSINPYLFQKHDVRSGKGYVFLNEDELIYTLGLSVNM